MAMIGGFFDVLNWVMVALAGIGLITNTFITTIPALMLWWILRKYGVKDPWQTLNGVDPNSKVSMVWNYSAQFLPAVELVFGLWSYKIFCLWDKQRKEGLETVDEEPAPAPAEEPQYANA